MEDNCHQNNKLGPYLKGDYRWLSPTILQTVTPPFKNNSHPRDYSRNLLMFNLRRLKNFKVTKHNPHKSFKQRKFIGILLKNIEYNSLTCEARNFIIRFIVNLT